MPAPYPCPCCGHLIFSEPPGSFEICLVCFWEDDVVQLVYPTTMTGANRLTLHESQREFLRTGACEARFAANVTRPIDAARDRAWRPFDPARDPHLDLNSPTDNERWRELAHDDRPRLYYWRDDYWLAAPS